MSSDLTPDGRDFPWGPIVDVHKIGEYTIIEYGAGDFEAGFHTYVGGQDTHHGFASLDEALAGAIAYKHEGSNHKADLYFMAALENLSSGSEGE